MLDGKLVTLRPWIPSDLEFLGALRNDVETQVSLMAVPRPNSPSRVQEWLNRKSGADDGLFFVIVAKSDSQPVGFLEIREMKPVHGWGSLGICVDRAARGKGFAREALGLVEEYCHRVFGLRKLVLEVTAENEAASSLYLSAGYEKVGVHHEHFFHGGRYLDVVVMEKKLAGEA